MPVKKLYKLKIHTDFKSLIRPLLRNEYEQLEQNIIKDGCRDPIVVWNGVIVDGHNRYEICSRHGIPFSILEIDFACPEAAAAWICANQLGRRNLSEEARKYLIGKQYESEKIANQYRNPLGINQHTDPEPDCEGKVVEEPPKYKHVTAERVAKENHVSAGGVLKYSHYAKSLDIIRQKVPELATKILSGRYKIGHEHVLELSRKPTQELLDFMHTLEQNQPFFVRYKATRQEFPTRKAESEGPSVKDMPAFDPDAEVDGLALTVPSWANSIDRAVANADMKSVSTDSKNRLAVVLGELLTKITALLLSIKENAND